MDMHTLEKNIVSEVLSEMDSLMITAETRVQEAVMTVIENLVILSVELAMKSVNASSGHGIDSVLLDPEQGDLSGNIKSPKTTASRRLNLHTHLNRIDETRGNITVERGDLLVNRRNIVQQNILSLQVLSLGRCCFSFNKCGQSSHNKLGFQIFLEGRTYWKTSTTKSKPTRQIAHFAMLM